MTISACGIQHSSNQLLCSFNLLCQDSLLMHLVHNMRPMTAGYTIVTFVHTIVCLLRDCNAQGCNHPEPAPCIWVTHLECLLILLPRVFVRLL